MIRGFLSWITPRKENMETYFVNVPRAKGIKRPDKVEVFVSLLGYGSENAVKREDLIMMCVGAGLIDKDTIDKDRSMRKLLARARCDYNIKITNDGKGGGYYLPTPKESIQLAKNNKREDKKAVSIFRNHKGNKALEEDYRTERIKE